MKTCLYCCHPLSGRSDKKFCNYLCRSAYHNQVQQEISKKLRSVDSVLKKNRRLLKELYDEGLRKIHRTTLAARGFDFDFCTHQVSAENGEFVSFCYDYGFRSTKTNHLSLLEENSPVKRKS